MISLVQKSSLGASGEVVLPGAMTNGNLILAVGYRISNGAPLTAPAGWVSCIYCDLTSDGTGLNVFAKIKNGDSEFSEAGHAHDFQAGGGISPWQGAEFSGVPSATPDVVADGAGAGGTVLGPTAVTTLDLAVAVASLHIIALMTRENEGGASHVGGSGITTLHSDVSFGWGYQVAGPGTITSAIVNAGGGSHWYDWGSAAFAGLVAPHGNQFLVSS